jgi:hypothetical protein
MLLLQFRETELLKETEEKHFANGTGPRRGSAMALDVMEHALFQLRNGSRGKQHSLRQSFFLPG